MTTKQLREFLDYRSSIDKKWPEKLEVNHNTYANVCQSIFEHKARMGVVHVQLGSHNGIMFHGVELVLKEK
jgi:hypothetical protein